MKKSALIGLILAILILTIITGCSLLLETPHTTNTSTGSAASTQSSVKSSSSRTNATHSTSASNSETKTENSVASETIRNWPMQLNEEVSLDDIDIIIEIKSINRNLEIEYTVQNNTSDEAIYYIESAFVNNCRVYDNGCYTKPVTAGNKAIDSYDIGAINYYGIKNIQTIDATFWIIQGYENHKKTVHLQITDSEEVTFEPELSSKELGYEDDNIELYIVKTGNSLDKFEYLICNKTEKWVEVDMSNVAINGIMSEYYSFFLQIIPKGYCYTAAQSNAGFTVWSALDDEIKEKGFDNVETISAKIQVWIGNDDEEQKYYEVKNAVIYSAE